MRRKHSKAPTRKVLTFTFQNVFRTMEQEPVSTVLQELHLGLGIEGVQRVVRLPQIHKTPESPLAIATIDHEQVLVLDLYYNLFRQELTNAGKKYLIVVKSEDILYGIPVPAVPILREVLETDFQALTAEYRVHDSLGIASHIFYSENQTFFLLHPPSLMKALLAHQGIADSLLAISSSQEKLANLSSEGQGELTVLLNSFNNNDIASESGNLITHPSDVGVDFDEASSLAVDEMVMMDFGDFTEEPEPSIETEIDSMTEDQLLINDFSDEPEPSIETGTVELMTEDQLLINDFSDEPEPSIETGTVEPIDEIISDTNTDTVPDLDQQLLQEEPLEPSMSLDELWESPETSEDTQEDIKPSLDEETSIPSLATLEELPSPALETLSGTETPDNQFNDESKELASDLITESLEDQMEVTDMLEMDNLFE